MMNQLSIFSLFLTLSCAYLKKDELASIILRLHPTEDITNLSCHDCCKALNSKPVLAARHFQYCVVLFLKAFITNGTLGKTKYYAI